MVVELIERRVSRQSAHALYPSKLVQDTPDREIDMEYVEGSYLQLQVYPAVKDFP